MTTRRIDETGKDYMPHLQNRSKRSSVSRSKKDSGFLLRKEFYSESQEGVWCPHVNEKGEVMNIIKVILEGDNCWTDLAEKVKDGKVTWFKDGVVLSIAALSKGMASGRPSISIRIDLPDGKVVVAETSMRLFLGAAEAFKAKYGAELGD